MPVPVVMAHALAELRYGIVARQHENGFKCGHNFAQTPYPMMVEAVAWSVKHSNQLQLKL